MIKGKVSEGFITQNPRTQRFYTKPKIHKEGIPGRPVISSVNCHSTKILEYDDYHLRPIIREIPSYIKETSDFLCKLKPIAEVPENSYCVTSDVKSYYTSILNSEGVQAVNISHENFTRKTSLKGNNYFLSSHSNFKQFYIQLKTLSTNQRLCNRNDLCTNLHHWFTTHGPFWKIIHISTKRRKTINIIQINQWYNLDLDRNK